MTETRFYLDLIDRIAQQLLTKPEMLKIDDEQTGDTLTLNLSCHAEDMGLLIGSGGQNIRYIRTILEYVAQRAGITVELNVREPWIGQRVKDRQRPEKDPAWLSSKKCQRIYNLLVHVGEVLFSHVEITTEHGMVSESSQEPCTRFHLEVATIPDLGLQNALAVLFHAIGRASGRNVIVDARLKDISGRTEAESEAGGATPRALLGAKRKRFPA